MSDQITTRCPCGADQVLRTNGQNGSEFDRKAWLANAKARNRAFVDEINARTVCAHCGAQPIEWHNPEHVEMNRQGFRISTMATAGSSVAAIQAEMDRCTPLCRRCHMAEDGRLATLAASTPPQQAPKPCTSCGSLYKPLARGLCKRCYRQQPDQIAKAHAYYVRITRPAREGVH